MSNEGKDTTGGLDPADDEALWRLLGRARAPEISPYFARRVLREVALAEEAKRGAHTRGRGWLAGLRGVLRRPRAAVWPGAMCVAVFWVSVVLTTNAPRHDASPAKVSADAAMLTAAPVGRQVADVEEVAPQDVEVIADLDNLISREESRLWTDDTARF